MGEIKCFKDLQFFPWIFVWFNLPDILTWVVLYPKIHAHQPVTLLWSLDFIVLRSCGWTWEFTCVTDRELTDGGEDAGKAEVVDCVEREQVEEELLFLLLTAQEGVALV